MCFRNFITIHIIHAYMIPVLGTPIFHSYSYDTIEGEKKKTKKKWSNRPIRPLGRNMSYLKIYPTPKNPIITHGKLLAPFRRQILPTISSEKRFDSQSRFMHPGFCKHRQGRICGNGILSKQRSMASPHRTNLLLAVVINYKYHVYHGILCCIICIYRLYIYHILSI